MKYRLDSERVQEKLSTIDRRCPMGFASEVDSVYVVFMENVREWIIGRK